MINWSWTDLKWDIQRKNSKKNNKRAYAKELINPLYYIIILEPFRYVTKSVDWPFHKR